MGVTQGVQVPGWGRSPGEGNDNPLQYSCLENPMDRGAWRATVHGVAKSQTRLSNFTRQIEPGRLQFMGSQKNRTRLSDKTRQKKGLTTSH